MTSKQIVLIAILVGPMPLACQAQIIRNYDVNFTSNEIIADGSVTPGEWDGAAEEAGDWRELRKEFDDVDSDGNRFRMLYDADNLYILHQSNYVGGPDDDSYLSDHGGNPWIVFGEENLCLYLDPNRDGDLNTDDSGMPIKQSTAHSKNVDGYQLSFNQYEGVSVSAANNRQGIGFFTEAHVNAPFGDQAGWNKGKQSASGPALVARDIIVAQNNSNSPAAGQPSGITEIVIPFSALDCPEFIAGANAGGPNIATGLNATDSGTRRGPKAGEVWGFNIMAITRDGEQGENFLPTWNWHQGPSPSQWPHGTLTFQADLTHAGCY